ncbi:probable cytochrome P450 9f2 [Topomyia yanbarensis]|uniref:probable cytochrome P450 9f2 n=1 Tax=Topomyia yanbarensis TaxID=2498891 RepID=UPI00273B4BAA|nr:probable cytochrome P450 9f2 [Topomyia yanbarensis]
MVVAGFVALALFAWLAVAALHKWITSNKKYFARKQIPSMEVKLLFGSTGPLIFKQYSFHGFIQYIYNKYSDAKVFGMFDAMTPILVVRDPELIKKITIKDFEYFADHRPMFGDSNNDNPYSIFGKTLFAMSGEKWRNTRATLSPAFTGSKMRQMFKLVIECCENVSKHYLNQTKESQKVGLGDLFHRFCTDVIASCAFGFETDSFGDRDNDFFTNGKKMMQFDRFSVALRIFGFKFFPSLMGKLGIDIIDRAQARYFRTIIIQAIQERRDKGIVREDMIQLLIQAKNGMLRRQQETDIDEGFSTVKESEIGKSIAPANMTENEMIAQAFIFFLGGFETVSTTLTFLVHDLVMNPDVQVKLYEEIKATDKELGDKTLNYDVLQKMKYMDMVVTESMRIRPAVALLDRICTREYVLDDGEGLKITVDKGTTIWVPVQGLHHDPQYYPNPTKFDPERFNPENRDTINPFTYLPFGTGPRNCIGCRFALMEVKALIYYLLLRFSFERSENTQVPLKLRKGYTIVASESEVYVDFKRRHQK